MQMTGRKLGSSNLTVNPIGLGTMPLAIQGRPSEAEAIKVIHAALDAGMDFIDTADVYCLDHRDIGYCEALIAKALKAWHGRNKIIVATKGGLERPDGAWVTNGNPAHLKKACEASLKALGVDSIELYQLHAPDSSVPFSDSIGALVALQQAGKIKHIGLSNVSVKEIELARSFVEIVSVQNRCNPYDLRAFKDGVVEYCEKEGIAFIPFSPVGGSGEKHLTANHPLLQKIAKKHNTDPFQVALAWLLAKSKVIIPIPGASKVESARSSAAAIQLVLEKEEIAALNTAFS